MGTVFSLCSLSSHSASKHAIHGGFPFGVGAVAQAQYPFYGNGFHNPLGYYGCGYNGLGYNGYGYNGFPVATRAAYAAPVAAAYTAPVAAAYTAPVAAAYTAPVAAPVVASAPV